jgi:hypothetical protein
MVQTSFVRIRRYLHLAALKNKTPADGCNHLSNVKTTTLAAMAMLHYHLLFFGLVPVGLYLLFKGIQLIIRFAKSAMLLEMPLQLQMATFTVWQAGRYAIWQAGRRLGKVPLPMALPSVYNTDTGNKLPVQRTSSKITVHDGSVGRIQVFHFWAPAGKYQLELPNPATDHAYTLQIREKRPGYLIVVGVFAILLAVACILTGLLVGINGAGR